MATVKIIHKLNKLNQKGEAPLYLRIIKDRKAKFISTGVCISPDDWNEKERKVRKSHPNSQRLNNYIAQKIAEAEGVALELETSSKYVNPKKIKEAIMGKSSESFLKYADRYITALEKKGKMGTHDKAKAVISKLKAYLGKRDLLFDEITVHFLKTYEAYLSNELNNSTNTIHSNLKVIRKLINDAINEDIFPAEKNPYNKLKLKWEKTTKAFTTEEELHALQNLHLQEGSMKYHHRNIYVFAAYSAGLRISDILQLKWANFNGHNIIFNMHKGKEVSAKTLSIKLPEKALEIINLYRTNESKPEDYIFPFFKKDIDYTDPITLFKAISSATAYTNTDLKDLAKAAGITHKLNFHTSRHTWATRALKKGMRIEHVSKLMGHSNIKTTQIYAQIVNKDLDNAMDVFNE